MKSRKIDKDHKSLQQYHGTKDMIDATQQILECQAEYHPVLLQHRSYPFKISFCLEPAEHTGIHVFENGIRSIADNRKNCSSKNCTLCKKNKILLTKNDKEKVSKRKNQLM